MIKVGESFDLFLETLKHSNIEMRYFVDEGISNTWRDNRGY